MGEPGNEFQDVIGAARKPTQGGNETEEAFEKRKKVCLLVATLLERFKGNPAQTKTEIRKELGITGECHLILRSTSFTIIFRADISSFLRFDLFRLPSDYPTHTDLGALH